jgi:uncharacterized SAM-binding protein YcdF (DUF218 family)
MSVTGWPYAHPQAFGGRKPTDDRPAEAAGRSGKRQRRFRMVAAAAVLAVLAGFAADFLAFVTTVTRALPPADARADAIVVLTGGADRIPQGLGLLADGRAGRMLISGVNPKTADSALLRDSPTFAALKACCIDLGREAADTVGNAAEARKWALANGFRSLVVVTSAYHIPRSLAEFADALPDRTLIAYPVVRPELGLDAWYLKPETARLLGAEYLKYLLVRARLGLERAGFGGHPQDRPGEAL